MGRSPYPGQSILCIYVVNHMGPCKRAAGKATWHLGEFVFLIGTAENIHAPIASVISLPGFSENTKLGLHFCPLHFRTVTKML